MSDNSYIIHVQLKTRLHWPTCLATHVQSVGRHVWSFPHPVHKGVYIAHVLHYNKPTEGPCCFPQHHTYKMSGNFFIHNSTTTYGKLYRHSMKVKVLKWKCICCACATRPTCDSPRLNHMWTDAHVLNETQVSCKTGPLPRWTQINWLQSLSNFIYRRAPSVAHYYWNYDILGQGAHLLHNAKKILVFSPPLWKPDIIYKVLATLKWGSKPTSMLRCCYHVWVDE